MAPAASRPPGCCEPLPRSVTARPPEGAVPVPVGGGGSPIVLSSLAGAVGFLRAVRGPCSPGQGSVSSTGAGGEALGREACCFTGPGATWGCLSGKCGSGRAAAPTESAPGLQGRVATEADGGGGRDEDQVQEVHPREARLSLTPWGAQGRPVRLRESGAGGSGSCTCQSCTEGHWAGGEVTAGLQARAPQGGCGSEPVAGAGLGWGVART